MGLFLQGKLSPVLCRVLRAGTPESYNLYLKTGPTTYLGNLTVPQFPHL